MWRWLENIISPGFRDRTDVRNKEEAKIVQRTAKARLEGVEVFDRYIKAATVSRKTAGELNDFAAVIESLAKDISGGTGVEITVHGKISKRSGKT